MASVHFRMLGFIGLSGVWFLNATHAQTNGTWLGTGPDGNWTTPANWTTVPGDSTNPNSGVALFNVSTNAGRTILLTAARNLGELRFDTASAGAFTISGSALQFYPINGTGAPTYSIQLTSSVVNAQTINAPLIFRRNTGINSGGNQTIINNATSSAATLTLGGTVTVVTADSGSGNRTLILAGSNTGANTISGIIQESGNYQAGLEKTGAGTWTLSGANTYTSTTTLTQGVLNVSILANGGTASSIGDSSSAAGNLIFNGGTLQYTGANATSNRAFTINAGKTATIGTTNNLSLAGATGAATNGALTKTGAGALTLTGVNTYTGATLVSNGTLLISGTGSINATSGITVSPGGTFRYDGTVALNRGVTLNGGRFANNSAGNYTGTLTFNSGTVAGTNLSGVDLTIGTNQILAPGNSTGTLTAGAATWANGGTLQFEINNATGTAGGASGWDLFKPTTLDITAGVGQFTVQAISLTAGQVPGLAQNFADGQSYQWLIVDADSAISNFAPAKFVVNTTGFQNAFTGVFSVAQGIGGDADKLYLVYSAIPEPSSTLLLTGGLMAVVLLRRCRRANQA